MLALTTSLQGDPLIYKSPSPLPETTRARPVETLNNGGLAQPTPAAKGATRSAAPSR
jgi:hypothetical protein